MFAFRWLQSLVEMSSPEKMKIRLEPEVIRAFLEQAVVIIRERKQVSSKLLKFVFASKYVLNASRRYNTYQFAIPYDPTNGFRLSFRVANHIGNLAENSFAISTQRLEKLGEFLNPKCIGINCSEMSGEVVEQCKSLLGKLKGKISMLILSQNTARFVPLIEQTATRIYRLNCSAAQLLEAKKFIPKMNLESYTATFNNYAVQFELLHLIKTKRLNLILYFPELEHIIDSNAAPPKRNGSIKHLMLDVNYCEYNEVAILSEWISKRFPNLEKLSLLLCFAEVFTEEVICNI